MDTQPWAQASARAVELQSDGVWRGGREGPPTLVIKPG